MVCGILPHPADTVKAVKSCAMNPSLSFVQTRHSHLRRLLLLRTIAVVGQCATLVLVYGFLAMELEWLPLFVIIGVQAGFNLFTWWRLRTDYPVSNLELFAQLCADVLALSVLFYFSGGSTNPFVSLFLLPLVIAAATLPRGYTWAMAAITTGCYTLLMKFYVPLPISNRHIGREGHIQHVMPQDEAFNIHIIGMWMGFVISSAVIAYFVVKMARAVRERDGTIAKAREDTLRNERIVALGMQAAGAAHGLGTPLSTLAVVIGELKRDQAVLPDWRYNLAILDDQVRTCKRILDKLLANAQDSLAPAAQSLEQFLADTLDEWQLLRPAVRCHFSFVTPPSLPLSGEGQGRLGGVPDTQATPKIHIDPALRAALLNLLNNASDASPDEIRIEAHSDSDTFTLRIHDQGPGLNPDVAAHAGSAFFTTKKEGRGLGLFLSNATIERMGGKVRLFNREGGGASTEIILPLR